VHQVGNQPRLYYDAQSTKHQDLKTMFPQNVRNYSPTDTASHPTRPGYSVTMLLVCICNAVVQDIQKVTQKCIPLNNILHLENMTMYFEVLSNVAAK
jgi:hypothetical protein